MRKLLIKYLVKYLALVFIVAGVLVALFWGLPSHWADGSGWVAGVPVGVGLFVMGLSYRNTGKLFTDESGGK